MRFGSQSVSFTLEKQTPTSPEHPELSVSVPSPRCATYRLTGDGHGGLYGFLVPYEGGWYLGLTSVPWSEERLHALQSSSFEALHDQGALVVVRVFEDVQISCGPRCEVLWFTSQRHERVTGEATLPVGEVIVALKGIVSEDDFVELRSSYFAGSLLQITEFFRKKKTIAVVPDPPMAQAGLGGLGNLDDLLGGLSDLEDMLTDPGERAPTPMLVMERLHAPVQVVSRMHNALPDPSTPDVVLRGKPTPVPPAKVAPDASLPPPESTPSVPLAEPVHTASGEPPIGLIVGLGVALLGVGLVIYFLL